MMCTMIVNKISIDGSGKGQEGWFQVNEASVSYDHPFHVPLEHALNIDFVNETLRTGRPGSGRAQRKVSPGFGSRHS